MAEDRKVTYTGAMATAGAIAGVMALLRNPAAAQAVQPFPPEIMELLLAMAADLSDVDSARLPDILAAIQALTISGGQGYPPNADYPISGTQDFLVALTPFQLPDILIPDTFEITVKAYPTNPANSLVYVAKSAGESVDRYVSYPLMPNESRGYRIKNAKELYVSATVAPGCSVTWTVEQRR